MTSNCIYAKKGLVNSGIDFNSIPKKKILMTCEEYHGTISGENYRAILEAINEIYNDINTC